MASPMHVQVRHRTIKKKGFFQERSLMLEDNSVYILPGDAAAHMSSVLFSFA